MTNSSEAIQRIEISFDEFRKGVGGCLTAGIFNRGELLDAYGRLHRLRERFMVEKEKKNLNASARAALSKVFEDDTFIEGMMNIRLVGEHVEKRGELVIWTTSNAPIRMQAGSSAMSVFSAYDVTLTQATGNPYRLEHLQMLQEAEKRIANAMNKAKA